MSPELGHMMGIKICETISVGVCCVRLHWLDWTTPEPGCTSKEKFNTVKIKKKLSSKLSARMAESAVHRRR
jgi:hypothetical protein